jgi:molybdate transport system ATP-binding protein
MLSVELSHRFGDFTLDVAFEAPGGVTVLFGRSGSGKTSVINAVAGLFHLIPGGSPHPRPCSSTAPPAFSCRRTSGAWAMCFRRRGCSRISVRQNLLYGPVRAQNRGGA